MSFYISLSGLKGAQADLSAISNNVANVNSTAFKKSKAMFGDIFAAAPMQTTNQVAGQGVRIQGITQQFTQGTIETTDKTLDLAITGEGYFTVKGEDGTVSYTRNGAFAVDDERYAVDTTGARMQVFAVDPDTGVLTSAPTSTSTPADLTDLQIPTTYKGVVDGAQLTSVGVSRPASFRPSMPTAAPSIWARPPWPPSTARPACVRRATPTGPRPWPAARRSSAPAIRACSARSIQGRSNAPTSTSPKNWSRSSPRSATSRRTARRSRRRTR